MSSDDARLIGRPGPWIAVGHGGVSRMGLTAARGWAARSQPGDPDGPSRDALWVDGDARVVLLATGASGEPGARAAAAAVRAALDHVRLRGPDAQAASFSEHRASSLEAVFRRAHAAVRAAAARDGQAEHRTSLLVALLADEEIWIGNVGGSHAFLVRGHVPAQLTSHDPAPSAAHPRGAHALGTSLIPLPESWVERLERDDLLVLCTAGVARTLGGERMGALLAEGASPRDICEALVRDAHRRGFAGDATAVVVRCSGASPARAPSEPPAGEAA